MSQAADPMELLAMAAKEIVRRCFGVDVDEEFADDYEYYDACADDEDEDGLEDDFDDDYDDEEYDDEEEADCEDEADDSEASASDEGEEETDDDSVIDAEFEEVA